MITRTPLLFAAALSLAAVVGCYTGPNSDLSPAMRGPGVSADGTEPAPGADGTAEADAGAAAATGLPCDVAKVLAASCTDCHGAHPTNGAPNSLVTYDDLAKPSADEPSKTVADLSLERMKAAKKPMPPDGNLAAADIAVLEKWIGAGIPRGSCGTKTATADGGSTTDAGSVGPVADGGADAGPAPSVCTSGTTWAAGTPSSALMFPGKACIGCHSAAGGPSFTIAGTVYPTLHEPNSCNGIGGAGMTVVIVDAAGKSHSMPVNEAGNFIRVTGIPMPYTAAVMSGTKVRAMKTAQTNGDCNSCHSEQGTHSPGRIMAP